MALIKVRIFSSYNVSNWGEIVLKLGKSFASQASVFFSLILLLSAASHVHDLDLVHVYHHNVPRGASPLPLASVGFGCFYTLYAGKMAVSTTT